MSKQATIMDAIRNATGRFTARDIADITGVSQAYANNVINTMAGSGELRKFEGTRPAQFKVLDSKTKADRVELDVATRFKYVENLASMVINGHQPSVLLTGGPGIGKTYLIRKQLKVAGLSNEDYVIASGHSTPLGLYQLLHDHRDELIIFDDCDSVFRDDIAVNILKAALDSYDARFISWHSSKAEQMELERCFEFTGRIIFISNMHISRLDPAVRSRAFCYNLHLSVEEIIEYMGQIIEDIEPKVNIKIKKEVLSYLGTIADEFESFSIRHLIQAIRIRTGCSDTLDWKTMVRVLAQ